MTLLILAGFINIDLAMAVVLLIVTCLSFMTVAQRMAYVWSQTRGKGMDV